MSLVFDDGLFRSQFPEFSSPERYPKELLTLYATVGETRLPRAKWCKLWTYGVQLFVAHNVTIAAQNQAAAATGGAPGLQGGVPNSTTVGSLTVSFDATTTNDPAPGAQSYNLTTYGKLLWDLIMIVGSGPIQLA